MELSREKINSYRKNMTCIREVADQIMDVLKGRNFSFSREISDKKGNFSPDQLNVMIDEMLSVWEQTYRDYGGLEGGTTDPSMVLYFRERYGLYRNYLYAAMFSLFFEKDDAHRADYASLAAGAGELMADWCVMESREGQKFNEPLWGFDAYAPFRFYRLLAPDQLSYPKDLPVDNWERFTNEGNKKRIHIIKKGDYRNEVEVSYELPYGDEDLYAYDDLDSDLADQWMGADGAAEETAEVVRQMDQSTWEYEFKERTQKYAEAYTEACQNFVRLYRSADTSTLRDFCGEIEEIIDLYLIASGRTVLTDIDACLNVYGMLYDRPLQLARKYERGIAVKVL